MAVAKTQDVTDVLANAHHPAQDSALVTARPPAKHKASIRLAAVTTAQVIVMQVVEGLAAVLPNNQDF